MSVTQDEIELVIDYSKFADKFFEKHNDVEEKFLQNLENFYLEKQENNINNEKNRLKSVCANDICFSKEEFEATFIKEQNIRKEAGQNNRKSYKFRYAR